MKHALTIISALLLSMALIAQPPAPHRQGKAGQRGHDAMAQLDLSPEQKARMKQLNEKFRNDMQTLNKEENITVKAQRDRREALVKAHKAEIEKMLTPAQKEKAQQLRTEAIAKIQRHATEHLNRMKQELNLTDVQVAALQANREKTRQQMKALLQNEKLDRTARQESLQQMKSSAMEEMKKVLTAEQQAKWEQMKNERKPMRKHHPHGSGAERFTR
jgi:Spy/CpxP family protein refolding chaperone